MPTDLQKCAICGMQWGSTHAGTLPCKEQTGMHPDAARERADDLRKRGCLYMQPVNPKQRSRDAD